MKHHTIMKIGLVLFLLIIFSLSCGGKVTTRPPSDKHKFTINGVLVNDLGLDKNVVYFTILRDSDPFDGALVKVGSDTIENQGSGTYYREEEKKLFKSGQSIPITVTSSEDDFRLATSVVMPGSFQITDITPRDSVTSGQTDNVVVSFSLSAGASGYFYSVLKPDGSNGFTELIPAIHIPNAHVLRDAFYDGLTYVTGIYKVYLVAYRASFLEYPGMAFYLPEGLPTDNVSGANGTIGAGVVAPIDSIKAR